MALDSVTGVLSGAPTIEGNYPLTITATDHEGYTGSREYYLVIHLEPTPTPLPDSVVHVTVGGVVVPDTEYTITSRNPVTVDFTAAPPSGELVSIWVNRGHSWYVPGPGTASDGRPLQIQPTPAANFLNGK